jgi:hypothetical protein
MKSRG